MIVQEPTASGVKANVPLQVPRRLVMWSALGRYLGVVLIVVGSLAPLYWTVITSIKGEIELNASPPTVIPQSFTLDHYLFDLTQTPAFVRSIINSTVIAITTTILALIFGSLCAYAIARMRLNGKSLVLGIVLSVHMLPYIVLVGPLFVLFTGPVYV